MTTNRLISALTLVCTVLATTPVHAAPSETEPASSPAKDGGVDEALSGGDLTTAREQAVEEREATPSAATWKTEAEVHEARGDYAAAIAAWTAHRDALPESDTQGRAAAEAKIAALQEASRGTVADEPASTHRAAFDAKRAVPPPVVAAPPPVEPDTTQPQDRIVRKWYFWVTIGAIVASAGAITGIAIKAARTEQKDALDGASAASGPLSTGPALLRF